MLKSIQKREDAEKLMPLIPKMRRGECDVLDRWFIQECMLYKRGLTREVLMMLHDVPETGCSDGEAWIRGLMAYYGVGVKEDDRRIVEILTPHQQDPLCAALLGSVLMWRIEENDENEEEEIVGLLERSAEGGCVEGLLELSDCYLSGSGVDRDYRRSYELVNRAAAVPHPGALVHQATLLADGLGVERNQQLAVQCYKRACSFNSSIAHWELGQCYHRGRGVEVNRRMAATLYRKAIVLGVGYNTQMALWRLPEEDKIPWGEWCPDRLMHDYVPLQMRRAMRIVLLMKARPGTLFAQLPKDIVIRHILFWICTEPN